MKEERMKWRNGYLDLTLVPLGLLSSILYHCWLWGKVKSHPQQTDIGINSAGRRLWVMAMLKDKNKDILVVQTIRNAVMGSTVMATSSIFLSSGLAAIISSTYSVNEPMVDAVYGAHGDIVVVLKYASILFAFLFAFLFFSLSINIMNQVIFLINIPDGVENEEEFTITPEYTCGLLEKGFVLHNVGNRIFYSALPLLLWIFEPLLVFLCSLLMVLILYNMDIVYGDGKCRTNREVKRMAMQEIL